MIKLIFIRKFFLFFFTFSILFYKTSFCYTDLNSNFLKVPIHKDDSLFKIDLPLESFKKYIKEKFNLNSSQNKSFLNHYSTNYHFFFNNHIFQNFYYSNKNIKLMLQKSLKYTNFSKIQIQLKKVVSYLICNHCQTGKMSFGNFDNLLKNNKDNNLQKKAITIHNFFRRFIYYNLSEKEKKFNQILKKIYISFFEEKALQIIYQVHLSQAQLNFLQDYFSQKYELKDKSHLKKIIIAYEKKDKNYFILIAKTPNLDSQYLIIYHNHKQYDRYLNYLNKVKNNLDQIIKYNQFYFLYNF